MRSRTRWPESAAPRNCSKRRCRAGERYLTELICAEADRIRGLIDRMEVFGDTRSLPRDPVNIHEVLDRVRKVARIQLRPRM